jgi:hypothetical protein
MLGQISQRSLMALMGAAASLGLYGWIEIAKADVLTLRALLVGAVATLAFFSALLSLSLRMPLMRAGLASGALGAGVAVLVWLALLRYDGGDFSGEPFAFTAVFALITLPLPFIIAWHRGDWRDYAVLFHESWDIALRSVIAGFFAGAVWLLIYLCHVLLSLVGLGFIDLLLDTEVLPFVITGIAGGFGLAVADEAAAPKGASLGLLLIRPLLPPLLGVVALFLLALPLRGLSSLFGGLSAGIVLLSIAAVAATLITSVVEARDQDTSRSRILTLSARAMAVLLVVLAVLAALSVGMRVMQYGWTPPRVYGALAALIACGYGAGYGYAGLRADWAARIRRINVTMAAVLIGAAALVLTPVMNAPRISAADQLARLQDGRTPPSEFDVIAMESWGLAGQAAMDQVREMAAQPGQEALAARLTNPYGEATSLDYADLRAQLIGVIPSQPAMTKAQKTAHLRDIADELLPQLIASCARNWPDLAQGCVLVSGDFLPQNQGDEAYVFAIDESGMLLHFPLPQSIVQDRWVQSLILGGAYIEGEAARAVIAQLQSAPPNISAAPINQLTIGETQIIMLP